MMINTKQFLKDIHSPIIEYSEVPQFKLADQKVSNKHLKDNRIVYNLLNFYDAESRQSIITKKQVVGSESEDFEEDIEITNAFSVEATLSIIGFGDKARNNLKKVREWFYIKGLGDWWLRDSEYDCVIKEVMQIDDRTVYLESDYEERYGFDVIIGFKDVVKVRHDTIERVEVTNKTTNQTKEIDL